MKTDTAGLAIVRDGEHEIAVRVLYRRGHIIVHDTSIFDKTDKLLYAVSHERHRMAYEPRFFTRAGAKEFADYVSRVPKFANYDRESRIPESVSLAALERVYRINLGGKLELRKEVGQDNDDRFVKQIVGILRYRHVDENDQVVRPEKTKQKRRRRGPTDG